MIFNFFLTFSNYFMFFFKQFLIVFSFFLVFFKIIFLNKAICFIKMAAEMAADGGQGEKFTINRLKTACKRHKNRTQFGNQY